MKRSNRRKTVKKAGALTRWFSAMRNRKVQAPDYGRVRKTIEASSIPQTEFSESSGESSELHFKILEPIGKPYRSPRETVWQGMRRAVWVTARVSAVAALLAAVSVGGYFTYERLTRSTYFTVKQISVTGTARLDPKHLVEGLQSLNGRLMFRLKLSEIRELMLTHPWIEEATVRRRFPDAIHIEIREHRAVAAVLLEQLYLVDGNANVFKQADPSELEGLPIVTGLDVNDYVTDPTQGREQLKRALAMLKRYMEKGAQRPMLGEINLDTDGNIALFLAQGGGVIRLGHHELSSQQLDQFDRIWANLGAERDRVRAMYFDNAVQPDRVVVRMSATQ